MYTVRQYDANNPEHHTAILQGFSLFATEGDPEQEGGNLEKYQDDVARLKRMTGYMIQLTSEESSQPISSGVLSKGRSTHNDNLAEINYVITLPAFRRQGIGSRLLEELEIYAAEIGYDRVGLSAFVEVIPFYEENQYIIDQHTSGDVVWMTKVIEQG